VQRLADVVAGRFCYSVMAASAATFAFWSLLGARSALGLNRSQHSSCQLLLSAPRCEHRGRHGGPYHWCSAARRCRLHSGTPAGAMRRVQRE